jgi:hypothetical protein
MALDTARRTALAVVVVLLVIEGAVVAYRSIQGTDVGPGVGWIRVGSTQQVDQAGVTFIDSVPAYVVVTPQGLIGLYAKSPQLGEPVTYCASSGYFEDAMHGSKFDSLGEYAMGPAPHGLDRLDVRAVGDDVWLDPIDRLAGAPRGTHAERSRPSGPFCTT